MKYTVELNLTSFNFWSEAKKHKFTYSELKELEYVLDEIYPNGCTETHINDLFHFEDETLCDWIGLNYDEYLNR